MILKLYFYNRKTALCCLKGATFKATHLRKALTFRSKCFHVLKKKTFNV